MFLCRLKFFVYRKSFDLVSVTGKCGSAVDKKMLKAFTKGGCSSRTDCFCEKSLFDLIRLCERIRSTNIFLDV